MTETTQTKEVKTIPELIQSVKPGLSEAEARAIWTDIRMQMIAATHSPTQQEQTFKLSIAYEAAIEVVSLVLFNIALNNCKLDMTKVGSHYMNALEELKEKLFTLQNYHLECFKKGEGKNIMPEAVQ